MIEPVVMKVEDVGGLYYGRQFSQKLQGGAKGWFDDVSVGYLNCWVGYDVGNVGAVWQGTGMEVVGSGHGIR